MNKLLENILRVGTTHLNKKKRRRKKKKNKGGGKKEEEEMNSGQWGKAFWILKMSQSCFFAYCKQYSTKGMSVILLLLLFFKSALGISIILGEESGLSFVLFCFCLLFGCQKHDTVSFISEPFLSFQTKSARLHVLACN